MAVNVVNVRIRWDTPWLGGGGRDRFPARTTQAWQDERRRLFERYTLPSLCAQTYRGHVRVFLLVDPALEGFHRWVPSISFDGRARPTRLEPIQIFLVSDEAELRDHLLLDRPELWTRIDSDDVLAPDALARMDAVAREHPDRWVQLRNGFALDESTGRVHHWDHPSPAFYGRLSRAMPEWPNHMTVAKQAVRVPGGGLFGVVVHGDNISNHLDRPYAGPVTDPALATQARRLFWADP